MSSFGTGATGNTEVSDNRGSTVVYSGSATTTPAGVPSVAGAAISQALIEPSGNDFQVSFDGGTTYKSVKRNAVLTWDIKGSPTQLFVKTTSGTSAYEIMINFEES